MEESISNSMLSRESNRLINLIGSADPPLLYGFGSLSFSFPFFPFWSAVLFLDLDLWDPLALVGCACALF